MKYCRKCCTEKPEAEFYKNGRYLSSHCRACARIRYQQWKKAQTPEQIRARHAKYAATYRAGAGLSAEEAWLRRASIIRSRKGGSRAGLRAAIQAKMVSRCPLLGVALIYETQGRAIPDNYATIDRIDSSRPYGPDNVWVISSRANRMKNDATADELIRFSKNILRLFGG